MGTGGEGADSSPSLVYDASLSYSAGAVVVLESDPSEIFIAAQTVPPNNPPSQESEYWNSSTEYTESLTSDTTTSLSDVPDDSIDNIAPSDSSTDSSSNYAFGPQATLSLSGEGNTSNARNFAVIEPISGLSTTQTTNTEIFVGFVGTLAAGSGLEAINPLEIEENQPGGSVVGEFNSTKLEGESITYKLINGYGDGNNSLFSLDADGTLRTLGPWIMRWDPT